VLRLGLEVCQSHCSPGPSPSNGVIYTSSRSSLPDGTPCRASQSQGICLDGACEPVGCDGMLWSKWNMDECGVWCGAGSPCLRVVVNHSPAVVVTGGEGELVL